MIQVYREQLKKDTSITPGKGMEGEQRDRFHAKVYVHLKKAMLEQLMKLKQASDSPAVQEGLLEQQVAERAREVVRDAANESNRFANLAYEAELVGNRSRAAQLLQSRLVRDAANESNRFAN